MSLPPSPVPTADAAEATDTTEAAVVARGVHRSFGPVRAVDGVDLVIPRGTVVALLGPNGAGKTTLLDMMLGFTRPTSGTLSVFGTDPHTAVAHGRVGAVLQTGGLLDNLTVAQTMAYVAGCHRRHLPVAEVMDRAGLLPLANRRVRACSGGERQRLRFGLALLTDPELLILDEPTAGMDVGARARFWETMHAEADRGRTVVFATHYLEEASDAADRIVLLQDGRIRADGTVRELTAAAPRTVEATWTSALDPAAVAAEHGLPHDAVARHGERVAFTFTGAAQVSDRLIADLLHRGLARDMAAHQATLDHVFLDLTR
ncbi:ABC transporter ATP-binding protein [Micrococcus sp.]|uniref:ABC transporter ATP-binding protein n=1 Tax=Micrococcus sp. TaxID=1271 RepID=UPI002A910C24|nr:ABC transporter ATP-binding protein [Micrococcus sp.]MDY6055796.1 ABC transporter ATP-binding protein [Micrococcus sp.]